VRRAIERVFKERVRAIDCKNGSYLVPSSTDPTRYYMVQADPRTCGVQCDCPAGEASDPCKHGVVVLLLRHALRVPHDLAHLVPKDMAAFLTIEPAPVPQEDPPALNQKAS
jgi:hypothetical protein